jgi:hypothetical protein
VTLWIVIARTDSLSCSAVPERSVVTNVLCTCLICSDLKLDDVVIDSDGHCRVPDFGLSQLGVYNGRKIDAICGTPCFMAPEVIITLF